MLASPRCGARTRCGAACRAPAVRGKCRCRMHGGAHGSGAPRGNRNAWKHGLYAARYLAQRRAVTCLLRLGARTLADMEKELAAASRPRRTGHRDAARRSGKKRPTGPPGA